jgi:hypothetical protein
MLKSNKYNNYSKKLLLDKNLIKSNNKSVISKFALYINMVVYNVVTLSCIIALLKYNTNKLNKDILYSTKLQINKMCNIKYKIKGGTVLPSSYFGQDDSKLYSFDAGTDVQKINFESGLIREQLGGGNKKGGCDTCSFNKLLIMSVSKILKEHKIKADKEIKQLIVNMIKSLIYMMINKMKMKMKKKHLKLKDLKRLVLKSKIKKLVN